MTIERDPFYQNIEKHIATIGCSLVGVFDGEPPFTYSIGLSQMKGIDAEIIVIGLNPHFAASIINAIMMRVREGEKIETDVKDFRWACDKNGDDIPTMFKSVTMLVPLREIYGCQAFQFYGTKDVPFIQLVMPDANGIFPGEEGFDGAYMNHRQPLLYDVSAGI